MVPPAPQIRCRLHETSPPTLHPTSILFSRRVWGFRELRLTFREARDRQPIQLHITMAHQASTAIPSRKRPVYCPSPRPPELLQSQLLPADPIQSIVMLWRYSWYLQRLKYDGKHKDIVIFTMFWRYSWYLQRLKYDGKHNNINIFAMFWRYSWYLQRLTNDGKHKNSCIFAMFWRYSWYLQRLKYDEKHKNIIIFAMFWRYSWYLQRLKHNGKHKNIIETK